MRPLVLCILSTVGLSLALAGPARAQVRLDQRPTPAFAQFRPPPGLPARPASVSKDPDDQRRKGAPWEEIVGVVLIVLTVGAFIGYRAP
jgi:hypothetical protein